MGLFGKSLDDMARKEMELRKGYVSRTPGEEVNVKIDDLRSDDIVKNANIEVAKLNYGIARLTKYALYVLVALIFIAVLLTVVENAIKPKPDYELFQRNAGIYLELNGAVSDYRFIDDDIVSVTVDDSWFNSSKLSKVRFCTAIRNGLTAFGLKYHVVEDDYIYTVFYDSAGVKVAKPNWDSFDILY
jgi:hypothetical protein